MSLILPIPCHIALAHTEVLIGARFGLFLSNRVALHVDAENILLEEAKRAHFTPHEKEFFDTYSLSDLIDDQAYFSSRQMIGGGETEYAPMAPMVIPEELKRDFAQCKVAELRDICRERGLPISGTKAVLIERIQADVDQQVLELQRQHKAKTKMKRPLISGRINGDVRGRQPGRLNESVEASVETEQYLEGLVKEYIQARGGQASSRDIGRYLAANADSSGVNASRSSGRGWMTALAELKGLYGGLNSFLMDRQDLFEKLDDDSTDRTTYEYLVALRE